MDRNWAHCQNPFCVLCAQSQCVKKHLNEETSLKYIVYCCCSECYCSNNLMEEAAFDTFLQFVENSEILLIMQVHKKHINAKNSGERSLLTRLVQWISWKRSQVLNYLLALRNSNTIGAQLLRNKIFKLSLHLANRYCLAMHNFNMSQKSADRNVQYFSGS